MQKCFFLFSIFFSIQALAQDSTFNSLMQGMESKQAIQKPVVKIFESERLINANTTELVGKGRMVFRVIHNFYDVAGSAGGIKNFFGLDNAADIKISFQTGLGKRLDMITSRVRGAENYQTGFSRVQKLWELGFKYKFTEQRKDDPSHPLSIALFANMVVSSMPSSTFVAPYTDSAETTFNKFSDRLSQAIQLIVARKFGKVSVQLIPSFVHRNRIIPGDDKSIFALGGAARIPLTRSIAFIVDYFHVFHSQAAKDFYKNPNSAVHPSIKFYDPLGVGFEITTAGHVFHLNFTNATEILENRFIPRTVTSWGKGQFRWGFTISRTFVLWREKH
ncbi:MAG: hypothetical protein JST17_07270 [Bacteroidetes bacterium]|nr:hypothetical protein [Bacteroidota bacterium]MBS1931699.1 hypothetical protein [Bacteroidota bacterium]